MAKNEVWLVVIMHDKGSVPFEDKIIRVFVSQHNRTTKEVPFHKPLYVFQGEELSSKWAYPLVKHLKKLL